MRRSRLPKGGENLFQSIKRKSVEAEEEGMKLLKLSIGQPTGPALLSARKAAAEAIMSDGEAMHEYQDNGSPGAPDFARRFVKAHVKRSLNGLEVDYLPVPGIKPMLGLVQIASIFIGERMKVATMTNPGYPTPRDWAGYLGLGIQELPLNPMNGFRFSVGDIEDDVGLIMTNYPHNPSGQIATNKWWIELCDYCCTRNIRLFNDSAYIALSHAGESCALSDVAVDFPNLSWAEAFSASKFIGNGTGWRIGAIVGSPDFVRDIANIKGNTDSGFTAPMAAGVLAAIEHDREGIEECRKVYERRLRLLINLLKGHGMQLAVEPRAGFFTLWKAPNLAFGWNMENAQDFNFMMIEYAGVVGVHFHPYIRYAVCGNIEAMMDELDVAFKEAGISY